MVQGSRRIRLQANPPAALMYAKAKGYMPQPKGLFCSHKMNCSAEVKGLSDA